MTHAPSLKHRETSDARTRSALPSYESQATAHRSSAATVGITRGLLAWAAERFPASHLPLFAALYLFAVMHARWAVGSGETAAIGVVDILGFLAVTSFFLVLRIADEHKDAAVDLVAHPHRVLSTGRITLGHLRALALVAVTIQLVVVIGLDGGTGRITLTWAVAILWSALMAAEFFVPDWLRPRMLLYALLHLQVMPILMIWMSQLGAGDSPLPVSMWPIPLVGLASGAAFEVARKLRAVDDEHPLVDTYTQRLGIPAAASLLATILAATTLLLSLLLLRHAGNGAVGFAAAMALAVTCLVQLPAVAGLWRFARERTATQAKAAELRVAAALMGGLLVQILFQVVLRRLS